MFCSARSLFKRVLPRLPAQAAVATVSGSTSRAFHSTRTQIPYFSRLGLGCALVSLPVAFAYQSRAYSEGGATREIDAGHVDDLKDGEMKEIVVGDPKDKQSFLLVRVAGEYYAIGSKCTHYGAPLVNGLLAGDEVHCPWHDAGFNVRTGDSVLAPALDGLPKYPLKKTADGRLLVTVPSELPKVGTRRMARRDPQNQRVFVIVGGGAAAVTAAETLRADGFTGRIVMVTQENALPYDRTALSKNMGVPVEKIGLRDQQFFDSHDIEVMKDVRVTEVDTKGKKVTLANGQQLAYDTVLLATGATPRPPTVPGSKLKGIYTLRTPADSANIKSSTATAKKVVVIGTSFIGMESAACIKKAGGANVEVVVVGDQDTPFQHVLGSEIGSALQRFFEDNGVTIRTSRSLKHFEGTDKVTAVVLDNGERIEADAVVVGIGVVPNTSVIKGLSLERDGSVPVDMFLKAGANVYAAGDIARYPYWLSGNSVRIEHWNVAQQHGRVAAHNMAGKPSTYNSVPFFWSMFFGKGLRYAGHGAGYDELHIEGDLKQLKFIAYYLKNNTVVAAASMQSDPACTVIAEAMKTGMMPTGEELKSGRENIETIKKRVKANSVASCGRSGGCCGGGQH